MMSLPADIALVSVASLFSRLAYTTAVVSSPPQNNGGSGADLCAMQEFSVSATQQSRDWTSVVFTYIRPVL